MRRGFLKYSLLLFLLLQALSTATIRYVSKTGTSTPPFFTWETASDSIQKCLNICNNGDTVIVANGVYKENLIINKYLWLIGSSMDSTIIDGTGMGSATIEYNSNGYIKNFSVIGKGKGIFDTRCIRMTLVNTIVNNCRISNSDRGISLIVSSSEIKDCIFENVGTGIWNGGGDTCHTKIYNSLILTDNYNDPYGIKINGGGNTAIGNIIIGTGTSASIAGIGVGYSATINIVKNNIVSGYKTGLVPLGTVQSVCENNVVVKCSEYGIVVRPNTIMRNNIVAYSGTARGVIQNTTSDYNLYWKNSSITNIGSPSPHDIIADPMFVKDTVPVYGGSYDFHLQAFSPAIDAGDPDILDTDGSRSDIGAYGGPGGIKYTYKDLAPRPPVNLTAAVDTESIKLNWNRNSEADFAFYKIYRDTSTDFSLDSTVFIASVDTPGYRDIMPQGVSSYYYKITAVDSQGNESCPSDELRVLLSGINDYPFFIDDYKLYQNYPNPFNPSTKIPFRLKEEGVVRISVYDITGQLIRVLINQRKESGYHEIDFKAEGNLPSGIYLYRIEVTGKGNIPVYSEMRKMVTIK